MKIKKQVIENIKNNFILISIIVFICLFSFFLIYGITCVQRIDRDIYSKNYQVLSHILRIQLNVQNDEMAIDDIKPSIEYLKSNWINNPDLIVELEENALILSDSFDSNIVMKINRSCNNLTNIVNEEINKDLAYRKEIVRNTFIIESIIGLLTITAILLVPRYFRKSNNSYYNTLLSSLVSNYSNNIFICLNNNKEIEFVSQNIKSILGIDEAEFIQCCLKGDSKYDELLKFMFSNNTVNGETITFKFHNIDTNSDVYLQVAAYINTFDFIIAKEIFICSDISSFVNSKAELEIALQNANKASSAKTQFLSHISHEIRTPIHAILGATDLANNNCNDDKVKKHLERIRISSSHLLSIINNCLDMSKIESGKMKFQFRPMYISSLIKDVINISQPRALSEKQDIIVNIHVTQELIICDYLKLKQALLNVITNAIKFNRRHKNVIFTINQEIVDGLSYLTFSIEDSGIGIDNKIKDDLFSPFVQGSSLEGTGLGLTITKKIVEKLNGKISFTSELNVGTVFHIEIVSKIQSNDYPKFHQRVFIIDKNPLEIVQAKISFEKLGISVDEIDRNADISTYDLGFVDDPQLAKKLNNAKCRVFYSSYYDCENVDTSFSKPYLPANILPYIDFGKSNTPVYLFNGERILLVDDSIINLEITAELLQSVNLHVDTANSGKEAIERFSTSDKDYYSLILMDVMMPDMNGYETSVLLRGLRHPNAKTIPIFAMTANAFNDDVKASLDALMNNHIIKPINLSSLCEKISNTLANSR